MELLTSARRGLEKLRDRAGEQLGRLSKAARRSQALERAKTALGKAARKVEHTTRDVAHRVQSRIKHS